jgi:hypothetical protein
MSGYYSVAPECAGGWNSDAHSRGFLAPQRVVRWRVHRLCASHTQVAGR